MLQGAGKEPEMASMRNVAGEVLGSMAAIEKALELGLKDLTIYYDYMGIEMWAKGLWKRNKRVRWPTTSMCAWWRIRSGFLL